MAVMLGPMGYYSGSREVQSARPHITLIWIVFSMDFASILNGFRWHSQLIPHVFFNAFMLQGIRIMTDAASRRIFLFLATSGGLRTYRELSSMSSILLLL